MAPDGVARTRVDLELANRGAARANACLGPGRLVSGLSDGASMTWVDHPGCVREFELGPGTVFGWSETHDVAVPPERLVEASIEVQILNPRRCSSVGCAGFTIGSLSHTTPK